MIAKQMLIKKSNNKGKYNPKNISKMWCYRGVIVLPEYRKELPKYISLLIKVEKYDLPCEKGKRSMLIKEIKVNDYLTKLNLPASDYVINPYVGCPCGCKYCYASFKKSFQD